MGKKIKKIFIFFLGLLFSISCSTDKQEKPITIYTIGDSTMADKKPGVYPETGWCQALPKFFDEYVVIKNHAVNGRSTKSFINEGRWQVVLDSLNSGDYVFIQFGHNDQKEYDTTRYAAPYGLYKENIEKFINEARSKEAKPILFTSIARRKFGEDGKLIDTHGDYIDVVKEISKAMNAPMIDLNKLTTDYVNKLGDELSKEIYLWTQPSEKFPEGRKDNTHLSEEGAKIVAGMVVKELVELKVSFKKHINLDVAN